jgi:hypothetical protein
MGDGLRQYEVDRHASKVQKEKEHIKDAERESERAEQKDHLILPGVNHNTSLSSRGSSQ